MNLFYVLLFLIILCAGAGIVYVVYYNKMQYLKTKIEHSESIIDETLRVRYDLLVHADNIVKSTLNDGKEYFKEYIGLKKYKFCNRSKIKRGFCFAL